jgi:uncharacterized membrane protein
MLVWLGVAVVVVGFVARINPLLVIAAAVLVTGWTAGFDIAHTLAVFGHAFNENRFVSVVFVVLPVIGLLERGGLQERARTLIAKLRGATVGRLLFIYMIFRQVMASIGLASAVGGQAQVVRPLIAPMAEAAAEKEERAPLDDKTRFLIRAHAAAVDNMGAFFGEDIFLAMGSVLLIKAFLDQNGIVVQPLSISLWSIPTAILATLIHGVRLWLLDRKLRQSPPPCGEVEARSASGGGTSPATLSPTRNSRRELSASPQGGGAWS